MEKGSARSIRRIVTDHDESGLAIFKREDKQLLVDSTPQHLAFAVLWSTDASPANNQDDRDGAVKPVWSGKLHNPGGGSILRFVDFPPHSDSPMHRTQSIDYGIVIWGEIEVELDNGDVRTLQQSDVCIQRGTNHLWRNSTDKWTRVAYVLLDALPIKVDGLCLPNAGFP